MGPSLIDMHDSSISNVFSDNKSSESMNSPTDFHANSSDESNTRSLQNFRANSSSETQYDQSDLNNVLD